MTLSGPISGGLSLPISSALSAPAVLPFYDADAKNLFDRFFVVPNYDRRRLISDQFTAGKPKSFWSKFDAFWAQGAHSAEDGRLNWLGDFYNCTAVNNPTFVVDRGYTGDGSTSYLDTGFNPATASNPKFTQNSGALCIRSNTDNTGTGSLAGYYDAANTRGTTINPKVDNVNQQAVYRLNQGSTALTSPAATSPTSVGMFVSNRVGATDVRGYRQGVKIGTGATASTVLANGNIRLGSINSTSFRACQFSMASISSGLTDQEVIDIYDWFEPYRVALGIS